MIDVIRVPVDELRLGMYVSKLDRPWIETPFLFQGFVVENEQVLGQLKECCQFVYVDEEKSLVKPDKRAPAPAPARTKVATVVRHDRIAEQEQVIHDIKEFKQDLQKAKAVHSNAISYIKSAMDHIRLGESVDTNQAKWVVNTITDSIVRNSTALVWLTHLKDRDKYTSEHSLNVCILSLFFGRSLGLSRDELSNLGVGALLHDIGKLRVPLDVLNKPAKLTNEEFGIIKRHPVYGYELLKNKDNLSQDSLDIIHHHHERLDGAGYPNGLKDDQINYFTKVVTIVDVYDAITSARAYHDAITPYQALNRLYNNEVGLFDKKLIEAFIKCLGIYPVGSVVKLSTGETGIVVAISEKHRLKPTLLLVSDANNAPYPKRKLINLASSTWQQNNLQPPQILGIVNPVELGINLSQVIEEESKLAGMEEIEYTGFKI